MPTFYEALPARLSSKHGAIQWTPASGEFAPLTGLLVIDTDTSRTKYAVAEFPADDGRGFAIAKLTPGTDRGERSYSCFVPDRAGAVCECRGFIRWGNCKHLDSVAALIDNDWI